MTQIAVRDEDEQRLAAELQRRRRTNKFFNDFLRAYTEAEFRALFDQENPSICGVYPWQRKFHDAGKKHPERLLMAANRVGKTMSASAEITAHLTGDYPPWWRGRKWNRPTRGWTGAERTEDSRDVVQLALLGPPGEYGTGWIPEARIAKITTRQAGVSDVVDQIFVQHRTGGISQVTLKTYQMEVKGWRGSSLDFVWLDEECKQEIYTECQTRVMDRRGFVMMTFTPLEGPTEVVQHFLENQEDQSIYVQNVTWDDAPHLHADERERLWGSYPAHERDARAKGQPMLGSGAVFPIGDDAITCDPFPIPKHFYRINGVDFGIDHPGAGVYCAWDKDTDTFYVYDAYKMAGQTPVYHAAALKKHGDWIPNAWPHDGMRRVGETELKPLKDQFRNHGAYMLPEHAHYPDARGNSREPSLIEMYEYMRTNRFKVFSTVRDFFDEKRLYHRKQGKIVEKNDDVLSAVRYAFVMRRYARLAPPAVSVRKGPTKPILGGRRWKLPS